MPKISEFRGMVIKIHWGDHPPPHIHVEDAEHREKFNIRAPKRSGSSLPPHKLRVLEKWMKQHREELLENFKRAHEGAPTFTIEPWR